MSRSPMAGRYGRLEQLVLERVPGQEERDERLVAGRNRQSASGKNLEEPRAALRVQQLGDSAVKAGENAGAAHGEREHVRVGHLLMPVTRSRIPRAPTRGARGSARAARSTGRCRGETASTPFSVRIRAGGPCESGFSPSGGERDPVPDVLHQRFQGARVVASMPPSGCSLSSRKR